VSWTIHYDCIIPAMLRGDGYGHACQCLSIPVNTRKYPSPWWLMHWCFSNHLQWRWAHNCMNSLSFWYHIISATEMERFNPFHRQAMVGILIEHLRYDHEHGPNRPQAILHHKPNDQPNNHRHCLDWLIDWCSLTVHLWLFVSVYDCVSMIDWTCSSYNEISHSAHATWRISTSTLSDHWQTDGIFECKMQILFCNKNQWHQLQLQLHEWHDDVNSMHLWQRRILVSINYILVLV
jgi:hypothetical protein